MTQRVHVLVGRRDASASAKPGCRRRRADRRRVAVGQIDAAVGQADVVDDAGDFAGGISSRMVCSTRSHKRAVSSMRVPVRARRCSLNWPLSTAGKKSWPSQGNSSQRQQRRTPGSQRQRQLPVIRRHASQQPRDSARESRSNASSNRNCMRTRGLRLCRRHVLGVVLVSASADTWPWSAPGFARAGRRPAWRRPRLRPAARTGTAPRRSGRTWARTRCRWRASKRTPERRSAARRREWRARLPCPCAMLRLMFSISTVASSTRMPTASARPPRVMMLMVSPSALSTMIEVRIDSGIETAMISVLRQLPRKTRIMSAGQAGGDHGLAHHAVDGRRARRSTDRPADGSAARAAGPP